MPKAQAVLPFPGTVETISNPFPSGIDYFPSECRENIELHDRKRQAPCESRPAENYKLNSRNEAVADAADGRQVSRLGRIFFDVAAEADDKVVDGASVSVFVQPPNIFQDRFARDGIAFAADQMAQEFCFHQRELNRCTVGVKFEIVEVDGLAIEGEDVLFEIPDDVAIGLFRCSQTRFLGNSRGASFAF